jgi:putative tryptophan/tyrosine transport system substrate-binding protein
VRRREFIAGLGAAVWSDAARAQQRPTLVPGFLSAQSVDDDYKSVALPFLQGPKEAGYVEGHDVAIEYRCAGSRSADEVIQ